MCVREILEKKETELKEKLAEQNKRAEVSNDFNNPELWPSFDFDSLWLRFLF